MSRVLLVEDNKNIAEGLRFSIQKAGYEFIWKENIRKAEDYISSHTPDMVLLDVTLPDGNGFEFFENWVRQKGIPTIFLTARDEENDIVKALDMGAEDYITKPFSTRELMARVKRVLIRNKNDQIYCSGDVTYDLNKMVLTRNGEIVELSSLELKIVHLLFLKINKVVSRSEVIDCIWEATGNDVFDHTVTVYIKRIREKLGDNVINTIKGIGYRVDENGK